MLDPGVEIIYRYFPALSETQRQQFRLLGDLYPDWNNRINVVSRKDIDRLYLHHVLHALGIAKYVSFVPGTRILDVGTGGGFPGIPLAILFPEVQFHLVDSIGKKIRVVQEIATGVGLKNVTADHIRAEQLKEKYEFVVSRAVTRLVDFYPWVHDKFLKENRNAVPNGILYLKGGDLREEIAEARVKAEIYPLSDYFSESFFETKHLVYIPV